MRDGPILFTNDDVALGRGVGDQLRVVEATADDADVRVARGKTIWDGAQERGDAVFRVARDQGVEDGATDVACGGGA
jgi:hypothetical protein